MLMNLQFFAHKKGGGSTANGRDSRSKRLGAKRADGQEVFGGEIVYRQRGTKIYPGVNVVFVHVTAATARFKFKHCFSNHYITASLRKL